MSNIIVLCGPQRVGKSTAANALVRRYGFVRVSFADPLYDMLATLLCISLQELKQLPKHEPLDLLEGKTLRHALQTLGTEWGRNNISEELWNNIALRRIKFLQSKNVPVVVDDCRFYNEYESLRVLGAKSVLLTRDDLPPQVNTEHASETDWCKFLHFDARMQSSEDGAADAILRALSIELEEVAQQSRTSIFDF